MKFRKEAVANSEPKSSREDVSDLAEALNLYRSAMHHVAEREAARQPTVRGLAERPGTPSISGFFSRRLWPPPPLPASWCLCTAISTTTPPRPLRSPAGRSRIPRKRAPASTTRC